MYMESEMFNEAFVLVEKLIRIQIELNGGENNAKVLLSYDMLFTLNIIKQAFSESLKIILKQIDIYNRIHGSNRDERSLALY
jgi:hypothetical protein